MLGNGVDMYDLIPELHSTNDRRLTSTNNYIWVGVIEKMNPSPPVPRRRTTCYSRRPVYSYNGRKVFSMIQDYKKNELDFYYIPECEEQFIESARI